MLEYYRFKEIHDLFLKGRTDEARQHMAELQGRYVALCDENSMLRTQIQGYEDILYLARNLIFDGAFYWLVTGSIKQGPFCPACYNRDGLLLRLADDGIARQCLSCNSSFARGKPATKQALAGVTGEAAERGQSFAVGMDPVRSPRKATIIPFGK